MKAADFDVDGCSGWTEKRCGGMTYYGGSNQCGRGSKFTTVIPMSRFEQASEVKFKAHIWAVGTWDAEKVFVKFKDQDGNVIGEKTVQTEHHGGNHNNAPQNFN
jgi:hypothetical protein